MLKELDLTCKSLLRMCMTFLKLSQLPNFSNCDRMFSQMLLFQSKLSSNKYRYAIFIFDVYFKENLVIGSRISQNLEQIKSSIYF